VSPSVDYVIAPIFLSVSEDSLRPAVREYLAHHNAERNQERLEELCAILRAGGMTPEQFLSK